MADFFVRSLVRNNSINLNFITTTLAHYHHRPTSASAHSILTFAAAVLVNLLQLKYQGKAESPFETHSKTMFLAVGSLVLYCVAYDAESRFNRHVYNVRMCKITMVLTAPLSLAALLSVFLPWFLSPVLFSLSVLFSFLELQFLSECFINLWKWITRILKSFLAEEDGRYSLPRSI